MSTRELPEDIASAALPGLLRDYLRAHGWHVAREDAGVASVWQAAQQNARDVLIPERPEFVDFTRRLRQALDQIAEGEGRQVSTVVEELRRLAYDVVRVVIDGAAVSSGSMPLIRAADCIYSTRDVVIASALSAHERRAVYGPRRYGSSEEYLARVRLAAPERGSFVVTVLSPVPAQAPVLPMQGVDPPDPFERRVVATMMDAIHVAQETAVRAAELDDLAPFDGLESRGVSANLCESVVRLFDSVQGMRSNVSVRWSARVRAPANVPDTVVLDPAVRETLIAAAQHIRKRAPQPDFEVVGPVLSMHRRPGELEGTIGVLSSVDRGLREVRVTLHPNDYATAASAHAGERQVRCRGELRRDGKFFHLRGVAALEVVPEDEDDEAPGGEVQA